MLAVMAQARFARSVHSFICELLMLTMPDIVKGNAFIRNDTDFCKRIDDAIRDATSPTASESDYVRAIINASCGEMVGLCNLLKSACSFAGLERVAAEYLDAARFREMLLRKNEEKLERIVAIVKAREGKPIKILMDVAKVLNENAEVYDEMETSAKRKAAAELKKVVENVTSIVTKAEVRLGEKIDEGRAEIVSCVEEVGGKVDAVGKKVDRIQPRRKRKSKYSDAQREKCLACWEASQELVTVRHSVNTRVTYKSVFEHCRRELATVGVTTEGFFRRILHAAQSRECEARKRVLEAKREAERKKTKCGIMRGMKMKVANRMLATALSIFAVAAPCLASDGTYATNRSERGLLSFCLKHGGLQPC